jgi:aminoglycoside phosphotransferase family enzyme
VVLSLKNQRKSGEMIDKEKLEAAIKQAFEQQRIARELVGEWKATKKSLHKTKKVAAEYLEEARQYNNENLLEEAEKMLEGVEKGLEQAEKAFRKIQENKAMISANLEKLMAQCERLYPDLAEKLKKELHNKIWGTEEG